MNKTCNPLQRRGERSVFCSYYKSCLDHAVQMSWLYWDCGDCRHKLDQGARQRRDFKRWDLRETNTGSDKPERLWKGCGGRRTALPGK